MKELLRFAWLILYELDDNIDHYKDNFIQVFKKLLTQCKEDNFVWQFCPSGIYIENFEMQLKKFLEENPEYYEFNYIENQKEEILQNYQMQKAMPQPEGGEYIYQKKAFYFIIYARGMNKPDYGYMPQKINLCPLVNPLSSDCQ